MNYDQIITAEGKKRGLLGELGVSTRTNIYRFKDMANDDVDQIANVTVRRKDKVKGQQAMSPSRTSAFDELKKLAELRTMGAITEEQFQEKKSKLMERI
ncbi:MAG: SHOCT domain-containing protein [Promethearchaeati archaeon SRVP18_Atabeyarchaeia-1]